VRLLELGGSPLPTGLTPHSLRRTFASVLYALGTTPPVVMAEMGHTDPQLALAIYAKTMSRDQGQLEELRELVGLSNGQRAGSKGDFDPFETAATTHRGNENPCVSRAFPSAPGRI
jgi:hypothetical protein